MANIDRNAKCVPVLMCGQIAGRSPLCCAGRLRMDIITIDENEKASYNLINNGCDRTF